MNLRRQNSAGSQRALRALRAASGLLASAALAAAACSPDPANVQVAEDPSTGPAMMAGLIADTPAPSVDAACLTQTTVAEPRQVALYMMLDTSNSMLEPTGTGRTKWDSVVRAVRGFLDETRESDLQVGVQFFPLPKPGSRFNCSVESDCGPDSDGDGVSDGGPCFLKTCRSNGELCATQADCTGGSLSNTCVPFGVCSRSPRGAPVFCELRPDITQLCDDDLGVCADFDRPCTNATTCDPTVYATPAVELGFVSDRLPLIDRALSGREPRGLTPTLPALTGAIEHARAWGREHPEQTPVVLLATDGLPTRCGEDATNQGQGTAQPIEDVRNAAAAGLAGEIPVRTFVIGVFEPGAPNNLDNVNVNEIAKAGGTERALFIDSSGDVDQQFLEALRAIRSGQLGCELKLPESNTPLDYFRVNLQFQNGATTQQLPFVDDPAGCNTTPAGWHYDVDPRQTRPSAIRVCPNVCTQIQAAPAARVQMQLGCATIIR